jgi:hypothetical protein
MLSHLESLEDPPAVVDCSGPAPHVYVMHAARPVTSSPRVESVRPLLLAAAVELLDEYLRWILDENDVPVGSKDAEVAAAFEDFYRAGVGAVPAIELDAPGMLDVIAGLHEELLAPLEAIVYGNSFAITEGGLEITLPAPREPFRATRCQLRRLAQLCALVVNHANVVRATTQSVERLMSLADSLAAWHHRAAFGVGTVDPPWVLRIARPPSDVDRQIWDVDVADLWSFAKFQRARRFDLEIGDDRGSERWIIPSEFLPEAGVFRFDATDPGWIEFKK